MNITLTRSIAAASLVLGLSALVAGPVYAQGSTTTRAQVKMERDTFLAMFRYDESMSNWVLKDGMTMKMPEGVASREEIKAMRDKFLMSHTWSESESKFIPVKGAPREMSKLTREQVKEETTKFLSMYRYDESSSTYVSKR